MSDNIEKCREPFKDDQTERLLQQVYTELRSLAAARLKREKPGSLQATALVHEVYLRLAVPDRENEWDSAGHFFAAAAESMRRILVDRARMKQSKKRGGGLAAHPLSEFEPADFDRTEEVLAIHEALETLSTHDPQAAKLVKLRYFAGLGHGETAAVMGISRRAADRLWTVARAWLFGHMNDS